MAFSVEPRVKRVGKNLRISDEACDRLDELTLAYGTTQGRIVEALLATYGPVLLRDAKKEKANA